MQKDKFIFIFLIKTNIKNWLLQVNPTKKAHIILISNIMQPKFSKRNNRFLLRYL